METRNRSLPGPGNYEEIEKKTFKGYLEKQVRMNPNRYETITLGPGAYRHQDGFGVYCPDDKMNILLNKSST